MVEPQDADRDVVTGISVAGERLEKLQAVVGGASGAPERVAQTLDSRGQVFTPSLDKAVGVKHHVFPGSKLHRTTGRVWAHDAAHGALFGVGRRAEVLGTIAMLPSLQPLRLWRHGHNRVHHGFTSRVTIDWIWRPWDPGEYEAKSSLARIGYRLERSVLGCAWHYLRRVWWDGMVRFHPTTPGNAGTRRRRG